MKHMILSFEMKGDVISDHFLMLRFQKGSLDTVGFRTFRTFRGGCPVRLKTIVTIVDFVDQIKFWIP